MHPRPNSGIEGINRDERLLANVRRHIFGLVVIYVEVFIGLIAAVGLTVFLLPGLTGDGLAGDTGVYVGVGTFLVVILGLLILVVATQVYWQNRLIISDKNITQVLQRGLFSRQVSELSMANVEDVTADQHGIFAHLFGYGTLRVETAGEQNNFRFIYCPNPNYYGKILLDARQKFLHLPDAANATIPAVQPPPAHNQS